MPSSLAARTGATLAALALATATATPCATARGSARATRETPIYVASDGCRGHAFRPKAITLACADDNLYATEIDYPIHGRHVYGAAEADAVATIHENDCTPNCAAGRFFAHRGALTLKRIVLCADGRLYYSRAQYTSPAGRGEADIQPFERCRVVGRL